jgi:hypothetical protein
MKRGKWWKNASEHYGDFMQTPELSGLVVDRMIKAAADGNAAEYEELSDAAQEAARWIGALQAVDQRGNPRRLLKLLAQCVPAYVFPHLVDLFERKLMPPDRGKPRTPSYARHIEGPEAALRVGLAHVKHLQKSMPLRDALAKVAELQEIPLDILTQAQEGRRGASRRNKKSSAHK